MKPMWVAFMAILIFFGGLQVYTYSYYEGKLTELNTSQNRVTSSGIILEGNAWFGLSGDPDGLVDLQPLNFGPVGIITSSSVSFYIVNSGKPMKAMIYWENPSWTPVSQNDLLLVWDLGDTVIKTGEIKQVTVTLGLNVALPTTIAQFVFEMHIQGVVIGG